MWKRTGRCLMPPMKFERRRSGGAERLDVGDPRDQLLEQHVDLHAGELGAEAEVRTAAAEGDVRVRVAGDVEA